MEIAVVSSQALLFLVPLFLVGALVAWVVVARRRPRWAEHTAPPGDQGRGH